MAASSRYPFPAKTSDEAEKYFLDFIESWRKAMNLEQFVLIGHSFGGFLAGLYASKYPQHIQKLLLLSPAGFTDKIDGFKQENYKFREGFRDESGKPLKPMIPKMMNPLTEWIWNK